MIKKINVMLEVNLKYLVGAIVSLGLSLFTILGLTQNIIGFNSVLSEMFFTFLALVLGIGNLIVSFKIIKNK
jgi:hypothetical protein